MADEHGGSLLHVVAAGMKQGVERELRTLREVTPFGTPRHGLCICEHIRWLAAVQADADGRIASDGLGQQTVFIRPQLFGH